MYVVNISALGKLEQGDSRQQAEIAMSHGFTCTKPDSAAKIPVHIAQAWLANVNCSSNIHVIKEPHQRGSSRGLIQLYTGDTQILVDVFMPRDGVLDTKDDMVDM